MVRLENLPTYYRNIEPTYPQFLKEFFGNMPYDVLVQAVEKKKTFAKAEFLGSAYLHEALTFLRISIFDLLAYKHLACGRHLPMAMVSLYYSYFHSISSLLRLRGKALVHVQEIPESFETRPRNIAFHSILHDDHTCSLVRFIGNEHEFIWNDFATSYRNLATHESGRFFRQTRYDWNYGLLYPSQSTHSFAQEQSKIICEKNFLDPNFESARSSGEAEYKHGLMVDYGYDEKYAGDLIKESIKILTDIANESEYKNQYIVSFEGIKADIDSVESNESTKAEIKKWFDDAITRLRPR